MKQEDYDKLYPEEQKEYSKVAKEILYAHAAIMNKAPKDDIEDRLIRLYNTLKKYYGRKNEDISSIVGGIARFSTSKVKKRRS